jgi:arylsulfatase A-like enzyme
MGGDETTLAELLRPSGYRTAMFGKWHLGFRPELGPKGQGFDRFVGFKFGAIDNYSHYYYWGSFPRPALWREEIVHLEPGSYFPDIMTDEAVRFIATERANPFFLYLPFNLPHYPMQPTTEAFDLYAHVADVRRRFYAACVTTMDRCIGRVLNAVHSNGLTQDTIVIFLSDHGHSEEDHAMGGKGRTDQLRGAKGNMWEGGIRVPCIVSWPASLPSGQRRSQPVTSLDWLPTIAEWCEVDVSDLDLDGHSLRSVIDSPNAPGPHEVMYWSWMKWSAVRAGPWKLVTNPAGTPHLSNLDADPAEAVDLRERRPGVARRLIALRDTWLEGWTTAGP